MPDRELLRTLAIVGFCLILPAYNWHYIIAPSHRDLALLVLAVVLSGAVFYELTMRDASMDWVLAGIAGVIALAALTWIVLRFFSTPLDNDHTPLLAARASSEPSGCRFPPHALQIILGGTQAGGTGDGPFTPFRTGVCPGPSVTRTPRGLLVNAFGYDDDGTLIYKIRDNQFERIEGDYLHLHRTDRSTLALYDKTENEILYLLYLNPNLVRIRGHFLCGERHLVTIRDEEISVGDRVLPQPSCTTLKPGPAPDIALPAY